MTKQVKISMSISKHYGAESVAIGAEKTYLIASPHDHLRAVDALAAAIHEMHEHYASAHLPQTNPTSGLSPRGIADALEEIKVEEIKVEEKGDKRYYKLAGGKYAKWGVRVWDEVLDASGINGQDLPVGVSPMSGRATVMLREGKPHKVIAFEIDI